MKHYLQEFAAKMDPLLFQSSSCDWDSFLRRYFPDEPAASPEAAFYSALLSPLSDGTEKAAYYNSEQVSLLIRGEDPPLQTQDILRQFDEMEITYRRRLEHIFETLGLKPEKTNAIRWVTGKEKKPLFPVQLTPSSKSQARLSCSEALATSLAYDWIRCNERRITPDVKAKINAVIKQCENRNCRFTSPWLLSAFLKEGEPSFMRKVLNAVDGHLGDRWCERIASYLRKENHKPYSPVRQRDLEALFWAKLLCFGERRMKRSNETLATERTVCRALVRCEEGTMIQQLKQELGEMADVKNWDALVAEIGRAEDTTTQLSQ